MGHERIGFLPKTKRWNAIAQQLSLYEGKSISSTKIAQDTLSCIQTSYKKLPYDESVTKAIKFLVLLSISAKHEDQVQFLNQNGFAVNNSVSLFSLLSSARCYITTEKGSLEVNKIVKDSILQAITTYEREQQQGQISLFEGNGKEVWKDVCSGSAFCELARSFFAALTDRHLKYYVERAAACEINDLYKLQKFKSDLSNLSETISHHAFETSKIMQSFAAGWFNKNVSDSLPPDSSVEGFLRISFGKMREEFRREAEGL